MKKTFLAAALLAATALTSVAHAEPSTYAIDPSHTFVTYEMLHFGTSTNRGRFDKKEGTVTIDTAAKTGKVEISFDVAAVNTGVPAMNAHLKSDDFFSAEKFPTATFVGDKFTFDGDKVKSIEGQFTMKGKTFPLTLTAQHYGCYDNPMLKRQVCGGDFTATLDRTLYGMDYGIAYGFSKDVKLVIQVEGIKQ